MPSQKSEIFDLLAQVVYGDASASDKLFLDLQRFKKRLDRDRQPSVSRAAIALWKSKKAQPKRQPALDFIISFLHWAKDLYGFAAWDVERVAAFEAATQTLDDLRGMPSNPYGRLPDVVRSNSEKLDAALIDAVRSIVSTSKKSSRSELDAFFRGANQGANDDESYYLCYRHSTNHGAIVKSFVIVAKTKGEERSTYVFNEFIGGGTDTRFINHLYRESEGVVLKLEKSFYFSGFNFNVPVDKRLDSAAYRGQRRIARWKPDGLVLSAFEYDDLKLSPGLFGGLTMTVADLSQPVVARVVMLHVGIKSIMGLQLSDELILPDVIDSLDLVKDLEATISKVKKAGGKRFGSRLEQVAAKSQRAHGWRKLGMEILEMIDNYPAWEARKVGRKEDWPSAQGALETFGEGRPRN